MGVEAEKQCHTFAAVFVPLPIFERVVGFARDKNVYETHTHDAFSSLILNYFIFIFKAVFSVLPRSLQVSTFFFSLFELCAAVKLTNVPSVSHSFYGGVV